MNRQGLHCEPRTFSPWARVQCDDRAGHDSYETMGCGHTDHINVMELKAVHLALRHFMPYLEGKCVLVRSDNTLAVYYIDHQGDTKTMRLLHVSRDHLTLAAPRLMSLWTMYIPGERNQVADLLSHQKQESGASIQK